MDYRSPWLDDELDLFRDAAKRFIEQALSAAVRPPARGR